MRTRQMQRELLTHPHRPPPPVSSHLPTLQGTERLGLCRALLAALGVAPALSLGAAALHCARGPGQVTPAAVSTVRGGRRRQVLGVNAGVQAREGGLYSSSLNNGK